MDRQIDNVAVYKLIKKLSTPFNKWRAFKNGVIDSDGNIIKKDLKTRNERDSFTKMDLLALNLKREIGKMPGGLTKMASYAAALYLVKENESFDDVNLKEEDINTIREYIEIINEEVHANHVSSTAIAGMGADYVGRKHQKKLIKRHMEQSKKSKEKLKDE